MERLGRNTDENSICVKVKSPRYKGTGKCNNNNNKMRILYMNCNNPFPLLFCRPYIIDYHLTVDGQEPEKFVPGTIADYQPGHSSIFEREKQLVSVLDDHLSFLNRSLLLYTFYLLHICIYLCVYNFFCRF